jgi:hypothetical protein
MVNKEHWPQNANYWQNRLFSINFDIVMTNKAKKSMAARQDRFFLTPIRNHNSF